MAKDWFEYQEEAAATFRALGFDAETNVALPGARTSHKIDVVVQSSHAGFEVTWLIECKHWSEKVSKMHVHALRTIVSEIGADKGILLCERGFQSGAHEAAAMTNVLVTSLADIRVNTQKQLFTLKLRDLYDRVQSCRERYWELPKPERIKHGLRPEVYESGYSGDHALKLLEELLGKAFRDIYPVETDPLERHMFPGLPERFDTHSQMAFTLEAFTAELESKLNVCEAAQTGNQL